MEKEKEPGIITGAEALLSVITVVWQETSEAKRQTELAKYDNSMIQSSESAAQASRLRNQPSAHSQTSRVR